MSTGVPNTQVAQSAVFTNFGSQRAMRAPDIPRAAPLTEAAMDDLAEKLGMDPMEFRLKNLPRATDSTPDLQGRARDGGRADRLAREAQAARQDRHRPDPDRDGRGPAHSGAAAPQQGKQVSCTINPGRLGRAQDGDPGHRHRRPDGPGDHRGRDPRPPADRHLQQHRQLDVPAGPGLGRLDDDAVDVAAVLRRGHQGPRRPVQEDRRGA